MRHEIDIQSIRLLEFIDKAIPDSLHDLDTALKLTEAAVNKCRKNVFFTLK